MPWIPAPRVGARSRRALLALAAAGALSCALAACTSPTPAPSPDPSPTATPSDSTAPIFASDEEALAAAVAAYERYLDISAVISAEGGSNPERLLETVTLEYAGQLISEFHSQSANGVRVTGRNALSQPRLAQQVSEDRIVRVMLFACLGVGDTRILDSSGADRTPADRDPVVPIELLFESDANSSVLKLAGSELWSGDDFC